MRRTTRGSSIVAIRRIRPPQFGHASTSTAKTLWSRSAQRQRGGGAPLAGGPAGCADSAPDPASAAVGTSAAIPGGAEQGVAAGPGVASDVVATTSATGPAIDAASSCVAAASARPYVTAEARHLARGAKTPW